MALVLNTKQRLNCPYCGVFSKRPHGLKPAEEVITPCPRGHKFIYHRSADFIVQAGEDPVTHIKGDDSNDGLSYKTPLATIAEAVRRVKPLARKLET